MSTANVQKHNNGIRHTNATKRKAVSLRRKGYTHREIVKMLGISNGSASLWTKGVRITKRQRQQIELRRNKRIFTAQQRQEISTRLAPYRKKEYSTEELILKIVSFYKKYQRIPLKREFNSLRVFRKHFGSWNNAIRKAGFEPNPELFSKRLLAQDGHLCDSFAEKIIDDWLFKQKISHQKNVRYPNTKMTADFFIPTKNIFIEFFGLKGVNQKYDLNMKRKLVIVRREKLKLISLFPSDLDNYLFTKKLKTLLS